MRQEDKNKNIHLTDMWKWHFVENIIHSVMNNFNYLETRPPILLSNEVIKKIYQSGDETRDMENLVSKLYQIKSEEDLSLRPDGTVTYLSEFLDLSTTNAINRIFYIGPMFRRSANPQLNGQFHQFGAEALGSSSYIIDIEIIRLGLCILKKFGLSKISLELSNFGCQQCRPKYIDQLKKYWQKSKTDLCSECKNSFGKFRNEGIDCDHCHELWQESPSILDYLCDTCKDNFTLIKKALANLMISYSVNPYLNMSFDYYNQVVFRYRIGNGKKVQYIGGGGRYDTLAQSIIGKTLPAIGLSANIEELITMMDERKLFPQPAHTFKVYAIANHPDLEITLLQIVQELHDNEIKVIMGSTEEDYQNQSQLARDEGSSLMIILDNTRIREGKAIINNLVKNHQEIINIKDILSNIMRLKKALFNDFY